MSNSPGQRHDAARTFMVLDLARIGGGVMSAENKALIRRWFEEVWTKGRADAIDEMLKQLGVASIP